MSLALLQQLRAANAFDHYPLFEALGELHVPFDSLVPGARVEARLDEALRRRGRVALVGGSGSGKSSVVSHVLGPMVEGLAPILIPVGVLPRARQSGLIDDRSAGRARERAAQTESVRMERSLRGSASVGFSWVSTGLGKTLSPRLRPPPSPSPRTSASRWSNRSSAASRRRVWNLSLSLTTLTADRPSRP